MDWPLAIARNTQALFRIIAALMMLSGVAQGVALTRLPRHTYRTILRVLRPAEAAVRRLIVILAHGLKITPRAPRPFSTVIATGKAQNTIPAFRLIDPLKRFSNASVQIEDVGEPEDWQEDCDDDGDQRESDTDIASFPRIRVPGQFDPIVSAAFVPRQDDLMNAKYIMRRLLALSHALENLPREARRLARWQARRPLALSQNKPARLSPLRPGRPPGFCARGVHEINAVLNECHALALDRLAEPNSS